MVSVPSAEALCQHRALRLLFLSTVATNEEISFIYFNLVRSKLFPGLRLFIFFPLHRSQLVWPRGEWVSGYRYSMSSHRTA